jgi:hypothetical protein
MRVSSSFLATRPLSASASDDNAIAAEVPEMIEVVALELALEVVLEVALEVVLEVALEAALEVAL